MHVILAILSGTSLGYAFERGDMCFHSTLRGLFRIPKELDLFRAYIVTLLVATPLVYGMQAMGWIDPWIPPFNWQANLLGGLIFGVGMVVASSCITGFFYKLGHGMLGILVGLFTWAIGDILVYLGPLSGLRDALTATPLRVAGEVPTVNNILGSMGWIVLLIFGLAALFWLWRAPKTTRQTRDKLWGWLPLGITVGLIIAGSWLLAKAGFSNYPFGTSYVPTQIYLTLFTGEKSSPWIPITLVSLILGAFIAAKRSGTLWVRGETPRRYLELGAGGFLMGVGAAIAGGCNLGHALVGVPLLSLGSISTLFAMVAGVFLANQAANFFSR
ncbi:MAG: YeeE/YedE family protein [Anaerolineales bacterium]|uniref:YeeE/YedE family protein n=1 Tax=Candidatus Desulfolinea nitratireducens TaxID=2841698 RepID=A0A8J6THN6_9CHLR|nr:YeeE/YedE family protein [Candidatus Desulfolinea nitratireducens]